MLGLTLKEINAMSLKERGREGEGEGEKRQDL